VCWGLIGRGRWQVVFLVDRTGSSIANQVRAKDHIAPNTLWLFL
jgi:hypothetical protein